MDGIVVSWTKTALLQRNQIFEYWNKRNKSKVYSSRLNREIKKRIVTVKSQLEIGSPTSYGITRMIAMKHYSLFYKHLDNEIMITAFWDNRQDSKRLYSYLN